MLPDIERAYLAGIVDGEGYIGVEVRKFTTERSSGRRHYGLHVRVVISNNDQSLIDWLCSRFHGSVASWISRTGRQSTQSFEARREDKLRLLEECLPFLIVKKRHAEIAAELIRTRASKGPRGYSEQVWQTRLLLAQELQGLTDRAGRRRTRALDVPDLRTVLDGGGGDAC